MTFAPALSIQCDSDVSESSRAEVIKIEHPVRGDDTRAWGPPYAPYKPGSGLEGPGESAYFLGVCFMALSHPLDPTHGKLQTITAM